MIGTVIVFENGWGFINVEGQQDVFVHHTGIAGTGFKTLDAGDVVEFDLEEGGRGQHAMNVVLVEAKPEHTRKRPYATVPSENPPAENIEAYMRPVPGRTAVKATPPPVSVSNEPIDDDISRERIAARVNPKDYPARQMKKHRA